MLEEWGAGKVIEANGDALREGELDRRSLPSDCEVDGVHVDGQERRIGIQSDREVGRKRVVLIDESETDAGACASEGLQERRRDTADD